jgi:hypothetical protein
MLMGHLRWFENQTGNRPPDRVNSNSSLPRRYPLAALSTPKVSPGDYPNGFIYSILLATFIVRGYFLVPARLLPPPFPYLRERCQPSALPLDSFALQGSVLLALAKSSPVIYV